MIPELIDGRYLKELRDWVGADVFAGLAAQAAENLEKPLDELDSAWRRQDAEALGQAAHRLKSAASSMGLTALAATATGLMGRHGAQAPLPAGLDLDGLRHQARQSLAALDDWIGAQPQLIPVPANPQ